MLLKNLESNITVLPTKLIGLTFHKNLNVNVAYFLGNDTSFLNGRVSIKPFKQINWIDFIFIIAIFVLMVLFIIR